MEKRASTFLPTKLPSGKDSIEHPRRARLRTHDPDSARAAGYSVSSGLLLRVRVVQLMPL